MNIHFQIMLRYSLLFIIAFSCTLLQSKPYVDSLQLKLNSAANDSSKVEILLKAAKKTTSSNAVLALEYASTAKALAEENKLKTLVARAVMRIGACHYALGNLIEANNFIKKSYDLCNEIDYRPGIATALNGLGVLYYDQGELQKALEYFNHSLEFRNKNKERYEYATTLNNIGNVHKDIGAYDEALKYYNNSVTIKKSIQDDHGIAMTLNNIGLVYYLLNQDDKAMEAYDKSIYIKNEINDLHGKAMTYHNIGWLYQRKGDSEIGLSYYKRALKLREEIGDKYGMAMTLGNMSELEKDRWNYDKAIFYLNRSLIISKEIDAKSMIRDLYLQLSQTQEMAQDYVNANYNLKQYMLYRDSLLNDQSFKKLSLLKAEMEASLAESNLNLLLKERQVAMLENKRSKIVQSALIIGVVMLLFIVFILAKKNKQRIRDFKLKEQLKIAAKNSNSYAIITDKDDKIIWTDDGFTSITGYDFDEVLGKTPGEVLRGDKTEESTVDFIESKRKAGEAFNTEILNYKKNGDPIWLTMNVAIIKDEKNQITRHVNFGNDVTNRKNAEKEIQRILDT